MNKELFSNSKGVNAFTRAQITTVTTTYGAWIDTSNFNSLLILLNIVITTGTITGIVVQEANASDQSDAAVVNDDVKLLNPSQFPIAVSKIVKIGTVSKKKYVRVGVTTAGTVSMYVDGMAVLSDSIFAPADVDSTIDGVLE